MRSWSAAIRPTKCTPEPPEPKRDLSRAEQADILDQLLAETQTPPQRAVSFPGGDWQAFLQKIVEPHLLPKIDYAEQAELEAVVNEAGRRADAPCCTTRTFRPSRRRGAFVHFLTRRLDPTPTFSSISWTSPKRNWPAISRQAMT